MNEIADNKKRAQYAMLMIVIVMAIECFMLLSNYMEYELLQIIAIGEDVSIEQANANDLRQQILSILFLVAYFISAITFIQWFRRAYSNLQTKVPYLAYTEGWAAGSWFVPVLNLFRPFQIMKELYVETMDLLRKNGQSDRIALGTVALIIWWTLWIINGILGQIVFRISMSAETLDELMDSTAISIVSNLVGIPLALITLKVIRDYSKVEPIIVELNTSTYINNESSSMTHS